MRAGVRGSAVNDPRVVQGTFSAFQFEIHRLRFIDVFNLSMESVDPLVDILIFGEAVMVCPDTLARIREFCGGSGPDAALDCSGSVAAHRLCIDAVRRKGKVACIGESQAETPISIFNDMLRKGLHLIGSWHYNLNDFPKLMHVIRHSPLAGKLVSHVFPMSAIQEAFETAASQQSAKILLKPWE
jgi:threonine dehydrogenase-like Zn-dependent dehydrogenase